MGLGKMHLVNESAVIAVIWEEQWQQSCFARLLPFQLIPFTLTIYSVLKWLSRSAISACDRCRVTSTPRTVITATSLDNQFLLLTNEWLTAWFTAETHSKLCGGRCPTFRAIARSHVYKRTQNERRIQKFNLLDNYHRP